MPEALKIIQFSKENMNGLYDSRLIARNELVRGLLDIVLRNRLANREFDCNALRFKQILSELSEEYDRLTNQLAKNKIKNVDPELERLVININSMIIYLIQELDKDRPSEINLSTYLVRLAKYTNELENKYNSVLYPEKKKLFQILRESKLTKWILGASVGAGLMGGVYASSGSKGNSNTNPNPKKIEIKNEKKKIDNTKTKKISVEEINAAKLAKAGIKVPEGYELAFIEDDALITAYTPTGKGLMGGINPDGTPYKETGRTSTNFNATKNYDGVAVDPKLIEYGALILIEDVGWKVADDTGAGMRQSNEKRGKVHIDVRVRTSAEAYNLMARLKTGHRRIYVFRHVGDKNFYNRVWDGRKLLGNKESNLFKDLNPDISKPST